MGSLFGLYQYVLPMSFSPGVVIAHAWKSDGMQPVESIQPKHPLELYTPDQEMAQAGAEPAPFNHEHGLLLCGIHFGMETRNMAGADEISYPPSKKRKAPRLSQASPKLGLDNHF